MRSFFSISLSFVALMFLPELGLTKAAFADSLDDPTDEELTNAPIWVIAKWDGSRLQQKPEGRAGYLTRTGIVIERVIRGDLKPAARQVIVDWYACWDARYRAGEEHRSIFLSGLGGDARDTLMPDVRQLQLWFLYPAQDGHLEVRNHAAIQPLSMEPYFQKIGSPNPEKSARELLLSEDPLMLGRTLRRIAGGILPWPYDPWPPYRWATTKAGKPLVALADDVGGLLSREDVDLRFRPEKFFATIPSPKTHTLRAVAASVYALLAGERCIPTMRKLLRDSNPNV